MLPLAKREAAYAVAAGVAKYRLRAVNDSPLELTQTKAKIYVLEPNRIEELVQATGLLPCVAAESKRRSGGLIHFLPTAVVQVQAAIPEIPGVGGPQAVQQENFTQSAGQRRKPPHQETKLRFPLLVEQHSTGGACFR